MNYKSMGRLTAAAVIFTQLLIACGGLSSKQKTAAGEAVAALRKIHAATEVGVNYQQYGMLVIDAKDKVNNANAVLPDGELKTQLNSTMDAYTDANQAWGAKISNSISLKPNTEPGATLMRKYNLKPSSMSAGRVFAEWLDPDEAMHAAWGAAWGHLLVAQKLLDGQ